MLRKGRLGLVFSLELMSIYGDYFIPNNGYINLFSFLCKSKSLSLGLEGAKLNYCERFQPAARMVHCYVLCCFRQRFFCFSVILGLFRSYIDYITRTSSSSATHSYQGLDIIMAILSSCVPENIGRRRRHDLFKISHGRTDDVAHHSMTK